MSFVDANVANGPHRYDVRAKDWGGNLSNPSAANVTVGLPDTQAPTVPANVTTAVAGSTVTITWVASTDLPSPGGSGISGYLVHDNFGFLAFVPAGTSYVHQNAANGPHRYEIRAQDRAGNNSAPSVAANATVGAPDTTAPSIPANVATTVAGSTVTVTWDASTDNVDGTGLSGYLVHDNFQYLAFVPAGTVFVHQNAANGPHRYEIRAQDRAGNNSAPSAPANTTVGAPDTTAPSAPTNVAATVAGTFGDHHLDRIERTTSAAPAWAATSSMTTSGSWPGCRRSRSPS